MADGRYENDIISISSVVKPFLHGVTRSLGAQKKADGVTVRLGIDTGGELPGVVLPGLLTSVAAQSGQPRFTGTKMRASSRWIKSATVLPDLATSSLS